MRKNIFVDFPQKILYVIDVIFNTDPSPDRLMARRIFHPGDCCVFPVFNEEATLMYPSRNFRTSVTFLPSHLDPKRHFFKSFQKPNLNIVNLKHRKTQKGTFHI